MKISEKQKQNIEQIAKKYQIRDIYIFGSEISGFKRAGSDLDVGVVFESGLPENALKVYGNIGADLSAVFPGRQLDLVFLEEAPLHFQYKAINEGQLIYSRDIKKANDSILPILTPQRIWYKRSDADGDTRVYVQGFTFPL